MAHEGDDPGSTSDSDPLLRAVAAAPERALETTPARVAHFRIVGRLGQGGMGIVYRAEDEKLRRTVALKVLPEAFAQDEDRRRRFLREARSAAALTHANIATIHEVDEDAGRVFIAMELVEGPTLRERIARGRLPVGEAVRIARGIARGLARAHARGIVHRDLKPDNVVVDADGEPKILDFGLAKLREAEAAHGASALEGAVTASVVTEEGRTLGTPQYMSPEQARGAEVDGRSDVFSLGVVLYEMLAGRRPFAGSSSAELLASILRDTPEPLGRVAPDVPAEIVAIVDRCLAKSPADRWPGARELLDALERIPTSGSVKSQVGVSVATHEKPRSRARIAAALLLVAVAGVAGVALVLRSRTAEVPAAAVPSASAASTSSVRAMTDWPPPKTSSPEAAALYAEALQAIRGAQLRLGVTDLIRCVALDPHFAAAHLRLAIFSNGAEDARQHLAAASQARAALDPRDQRFLGVAEAMRRYPWSLESQVREAKELAEAMPDDPEAQFAAAHALERAAQDADALGRLERALQLDPKFAGAEHMRARIVFYAGDADATLAAADRCLAIAPGAGACLRLKASVHGVRGQCQDLEREARQLIGLEPNGDQGYGFLMTALAAGGASVDALRQLANKEQALAEDADRAHRVGDQNAANLAVYVGDFASAEASLLALQKDEESRTSESNHSAEEQLISIYDEEGEWPKAVVAGEVYLRRMPAWTHDAPSGSRLAALAELRRAGRLSDAQARAMREAWLTEWRPGLPANRVNGAWHWLYAHWAESPSEAREALAALSSYSPLPPNGTEPPHKGDEGRVYALAGDADRAIPLLRGAVTWCGQLPVGGGTVPIGGMMDSMHDRVLLGQMLEQKSDRDGACAQYAAVLARWGDAKPRSVTADKARARSKALGCK